MKTALTIGFFDGVHLGHVALLKQLREHPFATIFTFSNHPMSVLKPPAPQQLIPLEEKVSLLNAFADHVIVKKFTPEFAKTSYHELLDEFDLSALILGAGSVFGAGRKGTEDAVRAYAKQKGIEAQYVPKTLFENEPISSSRIRKALESGNKQLAQQLLGRTL